MSQADSQLAFDEATADLYPIQSIAEEIIAFTQQEPLKVWRRLALELERVGSNVISETQRFGVTPHLFNEAMARFYLESDGFIYESIVESRNPYRVSRWREIVDFINHNSLKSPAKTAILMYGDSVGSDSICLKRLGYDVVYHDFDSYCARFAQMRFDRRGLTIPKFSQVNRRTFDMLICLEVAEHVPNPPEFIQELSRYLTPDGICIFSESFALLESRFPTHLKSNVQYAGRTDELFAQNHLVPIWRDRNNKPIIYASTPQRLRFDVTPRASFYRRGIEGLRLLVRTLR